MQLFSQYTLGVDIQNDYATAVSLKSSAKGYKLAGEEIFALDQNVPLIERIQHLGRLITSYLGEHNIYEPEVLVSVPGDKIIIREISFPLSVKENLQETMHYEVEKFVPFSVNDIYFDCQVTDVNKEENLLKVLLVVAQKKYLDPYLALQTEIGAMSSLETTATIFAFGIGAENSVRWKSGSGICIRREGQGIQCNLVKGQYLLQTHVFNIENEEQEFEKALEEVVGSFCSARYPELSKQDIYYLNEGNFQQLAAQYKGVQTLTPLPLSDILPATNFLTAYFLALKGQRQPNGLINLLPANVRRRPTKTAMYIAVVLTGLILLFSAGLAGNAFLKKRVNDRQLTDEITRLDDEVSGLPSLQSALASSNSRIAYLRTVSEQKMTMLDIVDEISVLLPTTAWIEKFDFSEKGVRIDGYAESASALIERFESSALFEKVSFLTPVRKGKDDKERFTIGFTVNSSNQ